VEELASFMVATYEEWAPLLEGVEGWKQAPEETDERMAEKAVWFLGKS